MTSNLEIVKLKVALDKLKEKKKSVEKNYFLATKNIKQIITKANSEKEKSVAIDKQKKLDEATNFAIQYLDKIISQIYSVLIEIIKNNQFQLKKSEEIENFIKNLDTKGQAANNELGQSQFQHYYQETFGQPSDIYQSVNYQQQDVNQQTFGYQQPVDSNQNVINQFAFDQSINNLQPNDNQQQITTNQYFYQESTNNNQPGTIDQYFYQQSPDDKQLFANNTFNQSQNNDLNIFKDQTFDATSVPNPILTTQQEKSLNNVLDTNNTLVNEKYLFENENESTSPKLNLVKEDNLSFPVVETDKLDEINEVADEVFSPNSFEDDNDFKDVSDETSKEIIKQIEALDEMNRSELDFYLSEVEKEIKVDAPKEVKAGLMRDDDYTFNSKFKEMEDKLYSFTQEIDTLKAENKTISDTNNTLFELLNEKQNIQPQDKPITSIPSASQYFAALDKSIDSAVTKLEKVATGIDPFVNAISAEQIKNLENLSMPLIKSLEKTLENLAQDVKVLKEENSLYRKQLSERNFLIDALKEEKLKKENELNTSYNS